MVELFFDLVFVFAVTQLSHALLADLSPRHAFEVALLMIAVWWVWIYTSWVTNWLDPERTPVRLALFVMMLAGLVMSASIPQAFGERGMAFAIAYAGLQVGRTLFFLACVPPQRAALRRNFLRILVWLVAAAVFWLAGGALEGPARLACWTVALALELVSPALYFRVPGLGRSSLEDWDVDGGHLSERCALFVIIALGESLLVSGATFAAAAWTSDVVAALGCALVGSLAMWWLYFHRGADAGHRRIAHDAAPGRYARLAYTYLHLPIVAGIIVAAVADELVLAHPGHADTAAVITILGGPALYLVGVAAFKWAVNSRPRPPLSHLAGLLLLAALAVPGFAHLASALVLAIAATAVLVLVAAWEELSLRAPAA
ncbi:MAG: low temperature requirement protein A [Piscinibacter sp.]